MNPQHIASSAFFDPQYKASSSLVDVRTQKQTEIKQNADVPQQNADVPLKKCYCCCFYAGGIKTTTS